MMKYLKSLTALVLVFAFISKPQKIARSTCGGHDVEAYSAYQFFEPLSFELLSDFKWKEDETEADNVAEWQAFFDNKPKVEDIQKIVYQVSAEEMQQIRAYVLDAGALNTDLQENSLVKYWKKQGNIESIDYLFYAKVCEPQAQYYDQWDAAERDLEQMRWLADAGKKYYQEKTQNDFLKLRYAYQAIRMAHYSEQYQKALDLYQQMVEPLFEQSESMIRYWALAHRAGALRSLGEKAEAAYLFSRVFEACPSKRVSSFLSFRIRSDEEWQACLDLCQSPEEQANLYFMRSLDKNSRGLEEMKAVYQLAPTSDKLPLMLVREVNRLENSLLDTDLSENLLFFQSYGAYPREEAVQELFALKSFIGEVQKEEEKPVTRPELWTLADAYLEYVVGSPQRAQRIFEELRKSTKDDKLKTQIKIFTLAMQISRLQRVDDDAEEDIYLAVKETQHKHLYDFMIQAFARLYKKQGDQAKAYLCLNYANDLKVNPKLEIIEGLLTLAEEKKHTAFEEQYLLPKIQSPFLDDLSAKRSKEVLLEMKATLLFAQDRLKEAVALYEQVPEALLYPIKSDPFLIGIQDCYDNCPASPDAGKYNRKTLAQKILALKAYADQNTVESARFYFELGTVYYNMTYFGNAWMARDYFRSSTDLMKKKEQKNSLKDLTIQTDCAKAKYYFDRAMNAAISRGNQELAALASFMAAKCEQNQYYADPKTESGWGFIKPTYDLRYRRYFARLRDDFNETQFYQKAIQECKYFHEFVKR